MVFACILLTSIAMAYSEHTEVLPRYLQGPSGGPSDGPSEIDSTPGKGDPAVIADPVTCMTACPGVMQIAVMFAPPTVSDRTVQMDTICGTDGAPLDCLVASLRNQTHACFGDADMGQLGQLRALCTADARLPLMRGAVSNATACDSACPGVFPVLGHYEYVNQRETFRIRHTGRRLAGHGRDIIERHALMNALCPDSEVVECFFNTTRHAGTCTMLQNQPSRPEVMDSCNVPMSVTVSMALTVQDPAAFVANADSAMAVAAGIATAANVSAASVSVELSVARRLEEDLRGSRRLQGTVNADATILVQDAGDVSTLQATVSTIEPSVMATSLNTALSTAGIAGVTVEVTSLTAEAAAAPSAGASAAGAPSGTNNDGSATNVTRGEDSAASKAAIFSSLLVALVAQFSFV